MPIAKKPDLGAKKIDQIIKKGGSTTSEKFEKDVINMSLKLSPQLNSTIESLQWLLLYFSPWTGLFFGWLTFLADNVVTYAPLM